MGIDVDGRRFYSPEESNHLREKPARKLAEYLAKNSKNGAAEYLVSDNVKDTKVIFGYEPRMNRLVAFKRIRVVKEDKKETDLAKKRQSEADILKKLKEHPNIVKIYNLMIDPPDLKDISETHVEYVVMEKLDDFGQLTDILAEERLRQSQAGKVTGLHTDEISMFMWDVASGLSYVHSRDLYHGDISPNNLIKTGNLFKIIDFEHCSHSTVKTDRSTVGTDHYRPPEAKSSPTGRGINACSDIFSVGAILYEMLTFKKLFDTNPNYPEELKKSAELPKPLDKIVETACQPEGKKRYSSIMSMNFDVQFGLTDGLQTIEEKIGRGENVLDDLHRMIESMHKRFGGDAAAAEKVTQCLDYLLSNHEDREKSKVALGIRAYLKQFIADLQKGVPEFPDANFDVGKFEKRFYDGNKTPRRLANDINSVLEILDRPERLPRGTLSSYLEKKALEDAISKTYGNARNFMKKFCLEDYNSTEGLKRIGLALVQNGIFDSKDLKIRCKQISRVLDACPSPQPDGRKIISTLEYITRPDTVIPIPTDMLLPARKAYYEERDLAKALQEAEKISIDYMKHATLAEIHAREALELLNTRETKDWEIFYMDVADHLYPAMRHLDKIDADKDKLWFVQAPWLLMKFLFKIPEFQERWKDLYEKVKEKTVEFDTERYSNKKNNRLTDNIIGDEEVFQPLFYHVLNESFEYKNRTLVHNGNKLPVSAGYWTHLGIKAKLGHMAEDPLHHEIYAKTQVKGMEDDIILHLAKSIQLNPDNLRLRRDLIEQYKNSPRADHWQDIVNQCEEFLKRGAATDIRLLVAKKYGERAEDEDNLNKAKSHYQAFIENYPLGFAMQERAARELGELLVTHGRLQEMREYASTAAGSIARKIKPWSSLERIAELERRKFEAVPKVLELLAKSPSIEPTPQSIEDCLEWYECAKKLGNHSTKYKDDVDAFVEARLREFCERACNFNLVPDERASRAVIKSAKLVFEQLSELAECAKEVGERRKTSKVSAISVQEYYNKLGDFRDKALRDCELRFGKDDKLTVQIREAGKFISFPKVKA